MKLASFDIFDTALIRRCGKPENIFYLMAERLWPKNSAKQQEFFKLRVESGKLKKNSGEVMLEEVYDRLQITDYRLQITDCRLQITDMFLRISFLSPKVRTVWREHIMDNRL